MPSRAMRAYQSAALANQVALLIRTTLCVVKITRHRGEAADHDAVLF